MNPGSIYQLRSSHLLPRHPAFQRVEGILDSCTYMWEYRKFLAASITTSMPANDATFYHIQKAMDNIKEQSFDIVHTHLSSSSDMYIFPLTAQLATPHITTLHSNFPFDRDARSNRTGDADSYYMESAPLLPMVAISESARQNVPYPLHFIGVVHHGLSLQDFRPIKRKVGDHFSWLGRFMPEICS